MIKSMKKLLVGCLTVGIACSVLSVQAQSWSALKFAAEEQQTQGHDAEAEKYWRQVWGVAQSLSTSDPRYYTSIHGLGAILIKEGKKKDAEPILKLACNEQALGVSDAAGDVAWCLENYKSLAAEAGNAGAAKDAELLLAKLKEHKTTTGVANGSSPTNDTASIKFGAGGDSAWKETLNSGSECLSRKKYDDAEHKFAEALQLAEASKNDGDINTTLLKMIALYYATNRYSDADNAFRRSMSIVKAKSGEESVDYAQSLKSHADLLRAMKKTLEATREDVQAHGILARIAAKRQPIPVTPGASGAPTIGSSGGAAVPANNRAGGHWVAPGFNSSIYRGTQTPELQDPALSP
jgi:tetratricopeptide (TPR) repeat protein